MIIKKVLYKAKDKSGKSKASFKSLANYILDNNKQSGFNTLANYMLDIDHQMDKVQSFNFTNCEYPEDAELCMFEIANTQALNTTTKQDKTLHLIVSFQEDEHPSQEVLQAIEQEIADSLGMGDHQRLSVVHNNTNNLHMHIAINKVDKTYKVINPYNDVKILQETAIKLETKFKLQKDNHIASKDKNNNYSKDMMIGFESWVKTQLESKIDTILANKTSTFKDIQNLLSEHNLELRQRRKGFVIQNLGSNDFCKASSIHRLLSKLNLEKRYNDIDLLEPDKVKKKQPAPEQKPIQEEAKKETEETPKKQSWIEFVDNLAKNNIDIQNASDWKMFQKYAISKKQDWSDLKAELQDMKQQRDIFKLSFIYNKRSFKAKELKKLQLNRTKQKRKNLIDKVKQVTFQDFIVSKALAGDVDAIEALRKKRTPLATNNNNLYSASSRLSIETNPDYITKNGYIVYKGDEKNKIIDKQDFIKVSSLDNNKEIILDALLLSIKRFGNELNITGDDKFKMAVLDIVNEYNLDVRFIDSNMEQINLNNKTNKIVKEAIIEKLGIKPDNKIIEEAINAQIKSINNDESILPSKKNKDIAELKKITDKIKQNPTLSKNEIEKLGIKPDIINSMDMIDINIKVDSFVVNDKNIAGMKAIHEEIKNSLKGDELKKFEKWLYIFNSDGMITDVTKAFYSNKGVNVEAYVKQYDMTLSKIDKVNKAIDIYSPKNQYIIKEHHDEVVKNLSKNIKEVEKSTQKIIQKTNSISKI